MISGLYSSSWLNILTKTLFVCSTLFLASCNTDGGLGDLERFVREGRDRDIARIDDIPELIYPDVFEYGVQDMRDPFQPPRDTNATAHSVPSVSTALMVRPPNPNREREHLEDFALDSLEMVGTMVANKVVWAVIKAPDGTIYRASIGNFLGYNDGVITNVDRIEGMVEVREIIQDSDGNWQERLSMLRIK